MISYYYNNDYNNDYNDDYNDDCEYKEKEKNIYCSYCYITFELEKECVKHEKNCYKKYF